MNFTHYTMNFTDNTCTSHILTGYVDEVYDETGFVWMEVKCSDETKTTAMFPISTGFRFVFGSIFSRITTCLVWSDWYNIVCDTIDTSNTYKVGRGRST